MASFLIIERDEQTAERLRSALVREGWQPQPFFDVAAALELPQDEAPDVVFVEAGLEKGAELLQHFCQRNSASASIALVSDPTSPVQQAAMKAGDQVLHRPVAEEALWAVIKTLESTEDSSAAEQQQPASAPKFTSEDIFGDLLLEVEDKPTSASAKAAGAPPKASSSAAGPAKTPEPSADSTDGSPQAKTPQRDASQQQDKDRDAINRRLEQTLSGVLEPRRKKSTSSKPRPSGRPQERPIHEALDPRIADGEGSTRPKRPRKPKQAGLGDVDKLLSETLSGLDLGPRQRSKAQRPPSKKTPPNEAKKNEDSLAPPIPKPPTSKPPTSKPPTSKPPTSKPPTPEASPAKPEPLEFDPLEEVSPREIQPEAPPEPPVAETPEAASTEPPAQDPVPSTDPLSAFGVPQPEDTGTGDAPRPAKITPLEDAAATAASGDTSGDTSESPLEYPPPAQSTGTGAITPAQPNLGELAGNFSTQQMPTITSGRVDPKPGETFGPYTLLERVAVGGMAEVWKARMEGVAGFQKTVAIKKILPQLTENEEFEKMFVDEAKLAAELNHPNIIHIYDLGEIHNEYYIAMEYVEGKDLRSILNLSQRKRMALPPGIALLITKHLASALDYAHRKRDANDHEMGLVHRDVSPQNVLISHEGDIKLCDFGIVKAVAKSSKTQMGALKGKLQYMSPEQAWGQDVDGRSDIFSLGAILFEMLTGKRLFEGDSELSILDSVRNGEVRTPRSLDPTVPEELDRLVGRAVAQKPENRFQTANELREEVESVMEQLGLRPAGSDLGAFILRLQSASPPPEPAEAPEPAEVPEPAEAPEPAGLWPPPVLDLPEPTPPTEWDPKDDEDPAGADALSSGPGSPDPVTSESISAEEASVTLDDDATDTPLADDLATPAKADSSSSDLLMPAVPEEESAAEGESLGAADSSAIAATTLAADDLDDPHDDTGPLVDAVPPSVAGEPPAARGRRWVWAALVVALLIAAAVYFFLAHRSNQDGEATTNPSATSTGSELPAAAAPEDAGNLPEAETGESDSEGVALETTPDGAVAQDEAGVAEGAGSATDIAREQMERLQAEQLAQEKERLQREMEERERDLQEKLDRLNAESAAEESQSSEADETASTEVPAGQDAQETAAAEPSPTAEEPEAIEEATAVDTSTDPAPVADRAEPEVAAQTTPAEPVAPPPAAPAVREGDLATAGPGVSPPVLVSIDEPKYPAIARRARVEGDVILSLLVDERGRVQEVKIAQGVRSKTGLNEAAVDAARTARFKPATKNGVRVKMWATLKIPFRL